MAGSKMITPDLAILIPTLADRSQLLARLIRAFAKQATNDRFVTITDRDTGKMPTGSKRNSLINRAFEMGIPYVAFFDDDDLPGPTYIQRQLEVVDSGLDCGELWGNIYFSGKKGMPFHHSIEHKKWWQDNKAYYRCPNHLNCIKTSIMAQVPFPDQTIGEDGKQSEALAASGLLKTMYKIPDVIYHYFTGGPSETELNYAKSLGV